MPRISAWANGLRTKATSCRPASLTSATYRPRPRIRRSSSLRGRRTPTPCPETGPEEGNSRSLRTLVFSPIEPSPISLSRDGLRQNRRDRVVALTRAQAERRLQQTLGNDLVVLVVAEYEPPGFLPDHREVGLHADLQRADFI